MDKLNSREIAPDILLNENKYKNRSNFAKFRNMTSVRARFVREDTFYLTYYGDEMRGSVYDGKHVDGEMLSDIFLLLNHNFEKIANDRKKTYTEYFIKSQVNKLTGLSLKEFLEMTEKDVKELMVVIDAYNKETLRQHEKAEKELTKN